MSQNAKQNHNHKNAPTSPYKTQQPVGDVSADDPVGVSPDPDPNPGKKPGGPRDGDGMITG